MLFKEISGANPLLIRFHSFDGISRDAVALASC